MKKSFHWILMISLAILFSVRAKAQEFEWPREKAFELGAGVTGNGVGAHIGYVRFIQPKKPQSIPFKKKFRSLIGLNRYEPFPCKKKQQYKLPPGISLKASLFYEKGSGKGIRYSIIGMDASLMYIIYSNENTFISLKGGITVSHNRLATPLPEGNQLSNYNQFKYGMLGGAEVERMIGKERVTSLVLGWNQQYLDNAGNWGNERWYGFVGMRFIIY